MNKTRTTRWKWLVMTLMAVASLSVKANALISANLNIDITITATKSVTVNTSTAPAASTSTVYNWTGTPNFELVSAATATVANTSGVLSEQWWLSTNATSLDAVASGSQVWTLGTSTAPTMPGADTFALQAVFGSSSTTSCPLTSGTEWNNGTTAPLLTASMAQYTNTAFADSNLNAGGGISYRPDDGSSLMYANNSLTGAGQRALCYRVILPASTSKTDEQIIQVIVTAQ